MLYKIQQRRDTAENWETENPILEEGELGLVLGSNPTLFKIGDGVTPWNELAVASGPQGPQGEKGDPVEGGGGSFGTYSGWTITPEFTQTKVVTLRGNDPFVLRYGTVIGVRFSSPGGLNPSLDVAGTGAIPIGLTNTSNPALPYDIIQADMYFFMLVRNDTLIPTTTHIWQLITHPPTKATATADSTYAGLVKFAADNANNYSREIAATPAYVTAKAVLRDMLGGGFYVGVICTAYSTSDVTAGSTIAGSNLRLISDTETIMVVREGELEDVIVPSIEIVNRSGPPGTWRNLGNNIVSGEIGLFQRTS